MLNRDSLIPKRILITGATGVVGPSIVQVLLQAGHHVRILARPSSDLSRLPTDQLEVIYGDITDYSSVAAAARHQDIVLHLAAMLHINNPDPELSKRYHAVNVTGTRHVAEAAYEARCERVIVYSTISVYGPTGSEEIISEESQIKGETLYAKTKAAGERMALTILGRTGNTAITILRLASVYGPHMKGNYVRLAKAIQHNFYVQIGNGENRRSLIFVDDVAQATLKILHSPIDLIDQKVFNVADERPYQMSEIIEALSFALGKPAPKWKIPVPLLRTGLYCAEILQKGVGMTPRVGTFTLDKLLEDVAIDSQRLQQTCSFQPNWSLHAGWHETVQQLKADGQL